MESNLFTLPMSEIKGREKRIFYEAISDMPDGVEIKISPFAQRLRAMGSTLSESSVERYARWSREWFGISFLSQGKGVYLIKKGV
ncbi:MAG: hypothetical protein PHF74_05705 [Dehalococcoidales bacterium]|nr:hypothetical protein [Dehalococcoidales bacterium]